MNSYHMSTLDVDSGANNAGTASCCLAWEHRMHNKFRRLTEFGVTRGDKNSRRCIADEQEVGMKFSA